MSTQACHQCGQPATRTFRAKRDACNQYASLRRAIGWCVSCWDLHVDFEIESKRKSDEKFIAEMAAVLHRIEQRRAS